jgi:hypothetical protein
MCSVDGYTVNTSQLITRCSELPGIPINIIAYSTKSWPISVNTFENISYFKLPN